MDLQEVKLGIERYGPVNRGRQSVFPTSNGCFPIEILARPGKNSAIRELHVVSEHVLFLKVLDLRIKSQRVEKNLSTRATSPRGKL
jgi:hypothetical protein